MKTIRNHLPVLLGLHSWSHPRGGPVPLLLGIGAAFLLLLFPSHLAAAPLAFKSLETQTTLLELFTSEGCSSCPPAEKWLSGLKESSGLWTHFVPLAFHVDYWDYLGWRDPWGAASYSERQRAYAELWHVDSVYTPGFVLNGRDWRPLWRPKSGPPTSARKTGVLEARSADQRHWVVSFVPSLHSAGHCELHAALLVSGLISKVKAGENRGEELRHDFVVTQLVARPLTIRAERFEGEFELIPPKNAAERLAIAVWITESSQLEPLQAIGGWLNLPGPQ
ncbi:MAG TPA: DUF1223 domain-containing protein [Verrucomicrobiae bacterium]|nr:DUF1223 domain-containing protein [Verrucomicrobiae bacterium]